MIANSSYTRLYSGEKGRQNREANKQIKVDNDKLGIGYSSQGPRVIVLYIDRHSLRIAAQDTCNLEVLYLLG